MNESTSEQVKLQEEVQEEEAVVSGDSAGLLLQDLINKLNILVQQLQSVQTTQTVVVRCLSDKGYFTNEDLSKAHALLVQEARERQEMHEAQTTSPSSEGIKTGTDKLPIEEAPTLSI